MASKNRRESRKKPKWTYFYLNGELHKALKRKRAEDLLIAWNYKENKRVAYILSDVNRNRKHAYSISEVAKILGRTIRSVQLYLEKEKIPYPQYAYTLDERKDVVKYFFTEEEVRDFYALLKTVHRGRPRLDGDVTNNNLPSPPEFEALLRNEQVLYTKTPEGEFVVVWKQPEW